MAAPVPGGISTNDFERERYRDTEDGATFTAIFQFAADDGLKIAGLELYENAFLPPEGCPSCTRRRDLLRPPGARAKALDWVQSLGLKLHRCQDELTACRLNKDQERGEDDKEEKGESLL